MKRLIFFIGINILLLISIHAQSIVSGYVYEDMNRNGKKDRRETGVANVTVSNGIDVVLTDSKGLYRLPVGDDNIIFVIKPSGYKVPLNEYNQPAYYYIHKPKSNPSNFHYKVAEPTGELPKSADFAIYPDSEPDDFTALVFGDPQPYSLQELDYFAHGIVSEIKDVKNVRFGISLGDIVGDNLDLHQPYIQVMEQAGIPWYNVMGNHDMNYDAPVDSLSDETFENNFGPANFSFNYGKAHFIVLDDILYPDPRDGKGYWGGFRKSQLDFVENDLKHVGKDKLVILAFHIPLAHNNEDVFHNSDRQRLFDLLKDYPYTLSLSAHTHLQQHLFYTKEDGWHQDKPHHEYNAGTTSGDWYSGEFNEQGVPSSVMRDGTPRGYAFLNIKGNQYFIDYKVAGKPKEYQMEIFCPKVVARNRSTSAGIYVNFFMGHKDNVVEYRVDNGEWRPMQFVNEFDPSYLHLLHRWDYAEELMPGRRPSNAVECTHLWRGNIPVNLPVGKHLIEVRATDMFGRTFTGVKGYVIEEAKNLTTP